MIPAIHHQPALVHPPVEYIEVVEPARAVRPVSVRGTPKLSSTAKAVVMYRLARWGAWVARNSDAGCGYPRHTVFARLAPPDPDTRRDTYFDDDEMEVDRVVCSLDDDARKILLLHFSREGTAKSKAEGLGISRVWYGLLLDKAVYEVHTKLG